MKKDKPAFLFELPPKPRAKDVVKLFAQVLIASAVILSLAIPALNIAVASCIGIVAISVASLAWKNRGFNPKWRPWNADSIWRPGKAPKSAFRRAIKNLSITLGAVAVIAATISAVYLPIIAITVGFAAAVVGLGIIGATISYSAIKSGSQETSDANEKPSPSPEDSEAHILEELIEHTENPAAEKEHVLDHEPDVAEDDEGGGEAGGEAESETEEAPLDESFDEDVEGPPEDDVPMPK